jgi:hypothetical protein
VDPYVLVYRVIDGVFPEQLLPVVYDTMRPPEIWKDADQ